MSDSKAKVATVSKSTGKKGEKTKESGSKIGDKAALAGILKTLPPCNKITTILSTELTSREFQMISSATPGPAKVMFIAAPTGLGIYKAFPNSEPYVCYKDVKLPPAAQEKIKMRIYAKNRGMVLVIECNDGFLYTHPVSESSGLLHCVDRSVVSTPMGVLTTVIAHASRILDLAGIVDLSKQRTLNLISQINSLRKVPDEKLTALCDWLSGIDTKENLDLASTNWMTKTGESIPEDFEGNVKIFAENFLMLGATTVSLETLCEQLEGCENQVVQAALALSPYFACPIYPPAKNAYVNSDGNILTPVSLKDIEDSVEVECLGSFMSVTSVKKVKMESLVYTTTLFKAVEVRGKGQAKGKLIKDKEPIQTVKILAKYLKFAAKHNPDAVGTNKKLKGSDGPENPEVEEWADSIMDL